ncbi:MAG: hypothetical protein ABJA66_08150 [Actinomycetota bacterium]
MSNSALAEIYFITAMMVLILIVCAVAIYFFFKTYKKEMREKELRKKNKEIQNPKSEIQH